ncbi:MAG: hypothetical protein ABJH52_01635 [Henriciella sp.]
MKLKKRFSIGLGDLKTNQADPETPFRGAKPVAPTSEPNVASDPRVFELVRPSLGGIEVEVMSYVEGESDLRPLLILNSIEFPMPPSVSFCETMKQNGLRVVFIRRLGFGGTPGLPHVLLSRRNIDNGAACITEASIIAKTIKALDLKSVVLLGVGSANSLCYRLSCMSSEIALSIFSNPVFNQDSWVGFRPAWFRAVLRQTVMTKCAFWIGAKGLKFHLQKDPVSFFHQMLSKSLSDQQYLAENAKDFLAASKYMRRVEPETFFYDLSMSLRIDGFLKDRFFENLPAVALVGPETTAHWIKRTKSEAERLDIPIVHAPRGGMLVAYLCPDTILEIIAARSVACK